MGSVHFFSPTQLLALYRGLISPCMEYASHIWGGSTHTSLLNRVESKAFRLINSPPLTDCLFTSFITSLCIITFLSLILPPAQHTSAYILSTPAWPHSWPSLSA